MSTSTTPLGRIPEPVQKFQTGQTVAGSYTLKAQLETSAGLARWSATEQGTGLEVTLQFLPAEVLNDQRTIEAVKSESRRNRQVIHPHIVRVMNFIEEKGWAALVTEKVDGDSVEALLEKQAGGCFDPADIKVWLGELCQTMEDAHRAGLIHRDLVPENLIATKTSGIKIAGFGIQRAILDCVLRGKAAAADPHLAYLSPQVLDGETAAASDDIYAFGALMHALLTGKAPFAGGEIIQQIRRTIPAPLTERRSHAKPGGSPVAKHWDKVVASCLEKQRAARPKSFAEIASKLGIEMPGTTINLPAAAQPAPAPATQASPEQAKKAAESKPEPAAPAKKTEPEISTPKIATAPETKKPEVPAPSAWQKTDIPPRQEPQPAQKTPTTQPADTQPASKEEKSDRKEAPIFPHSAFIRDEEEDVVRKTKSPLPAIAAAAAILLGVGIVGWFLNSNHGSKNEEAVSISPSVEDANPQITPARNQEPKPEVPEAAMNEKPAPDTTAPAQPVQGPGAKETLLAKAKKSPLMSSDEIVMATPTVAPTAAKSTAPLGVEDAEKLAAEKAKAAEQAGQSAEKAGQAFQEKEKARLAAQADAENTAKALAEKNAALAAAKKAADENAALRKQRDEARRKAEADAEAARKAAEEKQRLAAEAGKAAADLDRKIQEDEKNRAQAEAEIQKIQKSSTEREQTAAAAKKAADEAKAARDKQAEAAKQLAAAAAAARQQVENAKADAARKTAEESAKIEKAKAEEAARKAAEEAAKIEKAKAEAARKAAEEAEKQRLAKQHEQELLQQQAQEALKIAEAARKAAADAERQRAASEAALRKAEEDAQRLLEKIKQSSAAMAVPSPTPTPTPVPAAMATPPPPSVKTVTPQPTQAVAVAPAIEGKVVVNSLGMKFAPVHDVLFCIWSTRVSDYQTFVQDSGYKSTAWLQPGFKQGPDHPVVNVSWNDAIEFCRWLTVKERKAGTITDNQYYRLPTDIEWSNAVGLPEENGRTPEARDMGVPDIYPWGTDWPPPPGAGNYTGEETHSDVAIKGYDDAYPWTSPVGSFKPNKYALYDMGGNVWQWCMDWWNSENRAKVLRGGSWYNGALKLSLLSSCRVHASPDSFTDNYGFRVVIATVSSKAARR